MGKWLVLTDSCERAEGLVRKLKGSDVYRLLCQSGDVRSLVASGYLTDCFGPIASALQHEISGDCDASVLVGVADVRSLNPMTNGFNGLLGMLVLAFPEVRWRFIWEPLEEAEGKPPEQQYVAGRYQWVDKDVAPLDGWSDGQALRNHVRWLGNQPEFQKKYDLTIKLRERPTMAVAVDDEPDYALFHAYTAYERGFQACAVWRDAGMKHFFHKDAKDGPVSLVIEDLNLWFPDRGGKVAMPEAYAEEKRAKVREEEYPKLRDREEEYPKLRDRNIKRWFVSYDPESLTGQRETIVHKPCQGIYDLATQLKLPNCDCFAEIADPGSTASTADAGSAASRHSAPGRLAEVARHMLFRADRLLKEGPVGMREAVLAATLSLDAWELVRGQVPTVALEALRLRHAAEVQAECRFSGIQYTLNADERLAHIRKEVKAACRGFGESNRKKSEKNGEMMVLLDVVRVLREHGQFDEAIQCQNRIRRLHNELKELGQSWWQWIFMWPIHRYTECVFTSIWRFVAGFSLWGLLFLGLFSVLNERGSPEPSQAGARLSPFEQVFTAMTGASSFSSFDIWWISLTVFAVLAGVVHLGLFISLLYMYANRKE